MAAEPDSPPAAQWDHLPADPLRVFFSFLPDAASRAACRLVCTHWRRIADESSEIWGAVVVRRPGAPAPAAAGSSAAPQTQPEPEQLAALLHRQRKYLHRLQLEQGCTAGSGQQPGAPAEAGSGAGGGQPGGSDAEHTAAADALALVLASATAEGSSLAELTLTIPARLHDSIVEALPGAAAQLTSLAIKPQGRSAALRWAQLSAGGLRQLSSLSLTADFGGAGAADALAALTALTRLRLHSAPATRPSFFHVGQEVGHALLAVHPRLLRLELANVMVQRTQPPLLLGPGVQLVDAPAPQAAGLHNGGGVLAGPAAQQALDLALVAAAGAGNVAAVEAFLQAGADPNAEVHIPAVLLGGGLGAAPLALPQLPAGGGGGMVAAQAAAAAAAVAAPQPAGPGFMPGGGGGGGGPAALIPFDLGGEAQGPWAPGGLLAPLLADSDDEEGLPPLEVPLGGSSTQGDSDGGSGDGSMPGMVTDGEQGGGSELGGEAGSEDGASGSGNSDDSDSDRPPPLVAVGSWMASSSSSSSSEAGSEDGGPASGSGSGDGSGSDRPPPLVAVGSPAGSEGGDSVSLPDPAFWDSSSDGGSSHGGGGGGGGEDDDEEEDEVPPALAAADSDSDWELDLEVPPGLMSASEDGWESDEGPPPLELNVWHSGSESEGEEGEEGGVGGLQTQLALRWRHLETLKLADCIFAPLQVLPQLPALTSLHLALRYTHAGAIQQAARCSGLQDLTIGRCTARQLPPLLPGALPQLTRLRFASSAALGEVHPSWLALPRLLSFEVESCERLDMHRLPSELAGLTQLERIRISHQRMEQVPTQLTGLSQLTRLAVTACSLRELPEGPYLCSLRELVLFANQLTCVPPALAQPEWGASGLRHLDLSSNYTHTLSEDDVGVLSHLTSLTVLDLRRQQYSERDAHPEGALAALREALPRCEVLLQDKRSTAS